MFSFHRWSTIHFEGDGKNIVIPGEQIFWHITQIQLTDVLGLRMEVGNGRHGPFTHGVPGSRPFTPPLNFEVMVKP